jgi:hypothetical protein
LSQSVTPNGRLAPAGKRLVDGAAGDDVVGVERQQVDPPVAELVAHAHADLLEPVEDVELRDAEARDAVDEHGALQRRGVEPAAAAEPSGDDALLLADGREVVADGARCVDRQLGGKRAAADARRVGLGDAEHVAEHLRPDARARGGIAGDAIAGRDERVRAVVDVQQRPLRAFEEDPLAAARMLAERVADVSDHRPEPLRSGQRRLEDRLEGDRLGVEPLDEHRVVHPHQLLALLGESLRVLQVLHADGAARHLVLVGRADALARGADDAEAAARAAPLARQVDGDVERQDERARLADDEPRAHLDAGLLEAPDLGEQVRRIDDDAVADVAVDARPHHARGHQLQRRAHAVDDQRVPGVVAALEADHGPRVLGQPVDDLALAFVTPLGADDDDVSRRRRRHATAFSDACESIARSFTSRPKPTAGRLRPNTAPTSS